MKKILDLEIQMKNYIGFRADQTLGRKNGGVITYIKATEAVDAEHLIAKSDSCVEYQLIHMKKTILLLLMCTILQTYQQKNLAAP